MTDISRYYIPNAIVFITSVTNDRYQYLRTDEDVNLFLNTVRKVKEYHPFELLSYVIMPDHFHWLMRTDDSQGNFSIIMHSIKRNFTLNYKHSHNIESPLKLWQTRFWDHVIRDEHDLSVHFDYIHWNPIKHSYVKQPNEWKYSSFNHWYQRGYYSAEWGIKNEPSNIRLMDFETASG
jgi:putative transposase